LITIRVIWIFKGYKSSFIRIWNTSGMQFQKCNAATDREIPPSTARSTPLVCTYRSALGVVFVEGRFDMNDET
jgi:hypothetical protein